MFLNSFVRGANSVLIKMLGTNFMERYGPPWSHAWVSSAPAYQSCGRSCSHHGWAALLFGYESQEGGPSGINAELCLEESKDVKRLNGVKCITAVRIVKFSEISLQNLSSMRSRRDMGYSILNFLPPYELHPKVRVFSSYLTTPHTHLSHLEVKRPDVVTRSYDPLRTTLLHAVVRPFLNISTERIFLLYISFSCFLFGPPHGGCCRIINQSYGVYKQGPPGTKSFYICIFVWWLLCL